MMRGPTVVDPIQAFVRTRAGCTLLAALAALGVACSPAQKPVPPDTGPLASSGTAPTTSGAPAGSAASSPSSSSSSAPPSASAASADAGADAGAKATAPAPVPADKIKVKVVTIGMHVAGGPFDEPTKEPFKKAVEPHFPEIAQCWATRVAQNLPKPPKQVDVGVDLLIEATGGHPRVSNPRITPKIEEAPDFVPCVVTVFESVEFAKLVDRGRTGVSYSLRFTITP